MDTVGLSLGFMVLVTLAVIALCIAWVLLPLLLWSIRRQVVDIQRQGDWRNRMQSEMLDLQREQTAAVKAALAKLSPGQAPKD